MTCIIAFAYDMMERRTHRELTECEGNRSLYWFLTNKCSQIWILITGPEKCTMKPLFSCGNSCLQAWSTDFEDFSVLLMSLSIKLSLITTVKQRMQLLQNQGYEKNFDLALSYRDDVSDTNLSFTSCFRKVLVAMILRRNFANVSPFSSGTKEYYRQ